MTSAVCMGVDSLAVYTIDIAGYREECRKLKTCRGLSGPDSTSTEVKVLHEDVGLNKAIKETQHDIDQC